MKSHMGESESLPTSNPVFIVIMRNSRGKLFVYVAVLGVLCFIVFMLSSTHSSLKELEGINEKCQQQRDSLSAQLQVVYEHKNRLEKSLQQEKTDHKQTKEVYDRQVHELEFKLQEEKDKDQKLEAQVSQLKTNYAELEDDKTQAENALKEQLKTVQSQKDAEIEKLQTHISELLNEKDKLEMSNNAFVWKLEQHASEKNLCQLQQQQIQNELNTCQESLKTHKNTPNILEPSKKDEKKVDEKKNAEENEIKIDDKADQGQLPIQEPMVEEQKEKENRTSLPVKSEKSNVLEKPNVLPAHAAAGDGVLPKPLDEKDEANKEIDAAVELMDKDDKAPKKALSDQAEEKDLQNKIEALNDETKLSHDTLDTGLKKDNALARDLENHPQVLPPNNFADNAIDKDDHAAERGEYGPQYAVGDAKQQVEVPDMGKESKLKNVLPLPAQANNDLADAQMQDMMNKSPGEVNNPDSLHMPPHDLGAIDNKIQDLKNGESFLHRGADAHHVMDDKNYEEEDDDRDNDDEPLNVAAGGGMKNINVLQDNDFDDQENQDNADNAKEVEGVVVAPK
ncbi:Golgi integral membrane protein 4-like isoform X2 [Uloborus diversus]|uniref:Golgi integral membrane protein 4-like isoform X2 n=1 Tax=Uloborus diversus TaxID=327109 RepID=UPI00240A5ABB|nr:Golgi integral membrane protein 4-like isoform X2 [Uloborus diversus]XP_054723746.1 Golgi integral membrane protein 4-like isoform X2 [Uloborus diversus]